MTTRKLYIAGPMTGFDYFNYPAFYESHKKLVRILRGHNIDIVSPAHNDDGSRISPPVPEYAEAHDFYLRQALHKLVDCHAIYLLPGWSKSSGARIECRIAVALGMEVYLDNESEIGDLAEIHHPTTITIEPAKVDRDIRCVRKARS